MGMNFIAKGCSLSPARPAPNPNPSRWTLIQKDCIGKYIIVEVQYHDCTNYDGRKLMVFYGLDELPVNLDPHFSRDVASPVARFRPTLLGWIAAREFARQDLGR